VHVGFEERQQAFDGLIAKDQHVIDIAEAGDELGAISGSDNRPPGPLERRRRGIVVDSHQQSIGFLRGRLQISDVTDMQKIETAIRKRDRPSLGTVACDGVDEVFF
jgi:hypothetical protein